MTNPKNGIIWEGPSPILPEVGIVAILSGVRTPGGTISENNKTGGIAQLTILVKEDGSAMDHVRSGLDRAICGDCFHRGDASTGRKRSCYVQVFRSIEAMNKKLRGLPVRKGVRATTYDWGVPCPGQPIRFGTYGDPGLLPLRVLQELGEIAGSWTGYTHQWRTIDLDYSKYLMASCETYGEAVEAHKLGWRVFLCRSLQNKDELDSTLWLNCPASEEAGYRTTCENCRLCMGTASRSKMHIWIRAHGKFRMNV